MCGFICTQYVTLSINIEYGELNDRNRLKYCSSLKLKERVDMCGADNSLIMSVTRDQNHPFSTQPILSLPFHFPIYTVQKIK